MEREHSEIISGVGAQDGSTNSNREAVHMIFMSLDMMYADEISQRYLNLFVGVGLRSSQ
jgi:hypothetical protein